jgi:hypothetical protein
MSRVFSQSIATVGIASTLLINNSANKPAAIGLPHRRQASIAKANTTASTMKINWPVRNVT